MRCVLAGGVLSVVIYVWCCDYVLCVVCGWCAMRAAVLSCCWSVLFRLAMYARLYDLCVCVVLRVLRVFYLN